MSEPKNGIGNIGIIFSAHPVMEWNGEAIVGSVACVGTIVRQKLKAVTIIAQHMDGMSARSRRYTLGLKPLHHCVARHRRALRVNISYIRLPCVAAVVWLVWQPQPAQTRKSVAIISRPSAALIDKGV